MRLTKYSDYALRVLIFLGVNQDRRCTIREIASCYDISENHLMKLIHQMGLMGYVNSHRGKSGGLLLAKPPNEINLGELIRATENNFILVECFDAPTNKCPISGACVLSSILDDALDAFFVVLDGSTLEDLLKPSQALKRRLKPNPGEGMHVALN